MGKLVQKIKDGTVKQKLDFLTKIMIGLMVILGVAL